MSKNIVLCLDGTGNQLKDSGNTNIVKLYAMLDLSDPEKQVAFYDPGIGTFSAQGAWTPVAKLVSKLFGLAFGYGIKTNLAEAYLYLMQTYEPGDKVFVFGFSRGAYTARLLAGMTYRAGLLRRGCENLVPYLVAAFTKGGDMTGKDWDTLSEFTEVFGISIVENGKRRRSLPIEFLGLFDSVKALGLLRSPRFPYTVQLPRVKNIRHAIAIDERRRPYKEYIVKLADGNEETDLVEAWFAGVHSDVGGSFEAKRRAWRCSAEVDGRRSASIRHRAAAAAVQDPAQHHCRRCRRAGAQKQPDVGHPDPAYPPSAVWREPARQRASAQGEGAWVSGEARPDDGAVGG